jgi:hypothetical protein
MLAHLSQAGANWPQVKAHALRGWVDGGDGRLYHPVVAEKALAAWIEKLTASISGLVGNARRWGIRVDTRELRGKLLEAIERLRAIAPQHPALKKKVATVMTAGRSSGKGAIAPASPPDSGTDRNREGEGDREGYTPLTPQGAAPDGAEGVVFPNLDDYADLDDLVPADEPAAAEPEVIASLVDAVLPAPAEAPAAAPPVPAQAPAEAAVPAWVAPVARVSPNADSADGACAEAGAVCEALKAAGIADAMPRSRKLKALIDVGVEQSEFVDAARHAMASGSPRFGYVLGIVAGERRRAAELAAQLRAGPPPAKARPVDRPTFAQTQADIARSTVPGREGRDPTLARIKADAARAAPMPPHIRAQIDAMLGRVAA